MHHLPPRANPAEVLLASSFRLNIICLWAHTGLEEIWHSAGFRCRRGCMAFQSRVLGGHRARRQLEQAGAGWWNSYVCWRIWYFSSFHLNFYLQIFSGVLPQAKKETFLKLYKPKVVILVSVPGGRISEFNRSKCIRFDKVWSENESCLQGGQEHWELLHKRMSQWLIMTEKLIAGCAVKSTLK